MVKNNQTKVLVIDDDEAFTDMLKLILEPNAFEVFVAHTGPDGIEETRRLNPDVIILDLFMPSMDGWEVCNAIRSFSRVPILILSAVINPGMVAKALDEGADDYKLKPIPSGVLIARLRMLARRAQAEKEALQTNINLSRI